MNSENKKDVIKFKKSSLKEMIDNVFSLIMDSEYRKDGYCKSYLMRINNIISEAMLDDDEYRSV